MEAAAAIFAVISALVLVFLVIATVKAVRAVKRGVDRTVDQARRTVEDTRLKARQYTQTGVAGEVAQLRVGLRTSMRATQDALRAGVAEDPTLSESLSLFERLSAHGRELDEDLRRLETEPDRARVAECLPELRERTERIRHSADSLRWAARDRARRFADDDLAALNDQIEMEAGALRHWTTAAEARSAAAPEAPEAAGRSEQSEQSAPGGAGRERAAVEGRADWTRREFPWQKARKPQQTG
ncbi:hypothetical protein AB0K09_22350 [Streptomyces sp. NPDC049577]|uniref:hypothetical protein n=1 Tax=Streptomyces sp. NPDC049577 TaxID=3155153 RepID=UPI0034396602